MSYIEVHGKPDVGILPLLHEGYEQGNPGFSLHLRACKMATSIKGRYDTASGQGHWELNRKTTGDIVGGNYWLNAPDKRPIPAWSWAWPSEIATKVFSGTPTGGQRPIDAPPPVISEDKDSDIGNNAEPRNKTNINPISKVAVNATAIPKGTAGNGDDRFIPKQVLIPFRTGKAGKDPNAAARAQQAQQAGAQDPNKADTGQQVLFLGIGANAAAQGFGGQGVGTGSGFPAFGGVKTNFSGSGFPKFQGVRTNFSSGNRKVGATFSP